MILLSLIFIGITTSFLLFLFSFSRLSLLGNDDGANDLDLSLTRALL